MIKAKKYENFNMWYNRGNIKKTRKDTMLKFSEVVSVPMLLY